MSGQGGYTYLAGHAEYKALRHSLEDGRCGETDISLTRAGPTVWPARADGKPSLEDGGCREAFVRFDEEQR